MGRGKPSPFSPPAACWSSGLRRTRWSLLVLEVLPGVFFPFCIYQTCRWVNVSLCWTVCSWKTQSVFNKTFILKGRHRVNSPWLPLQWRFGGSAIRLLSATLSIKDKSSTGRSLFQCCCDKLLISGLMCSGHRGGRGLSALMHCRHLRVACGFRGRSCCTALKALILEEMEAGKHNLSQMSDYFCSAVQWTHFTCYFTLKRREELSCCSNCTNLISSPLNWGFTECLSRSVS